ncbi:hypothetical protein K438DRAFT_1954110 [Mycena galopus ATCC 62051]|nr:hypothetical protein K438DRAFT_1954110 [Mycena galopus ATCC 62051]
MPNQVPTTHEFMLPPPRRRWVTVEEVLDEDNISILTHDSHNSDGLVEDDDPAQELQDKLEHLHAESPLPDGRLREALTLSAASAALKSLQELLRPHRKNGIGYLNPHIDPFIRFCMENMVIMLNLYAGDHSLTKGLWTVSSLQAAVSRGKGRCFARQLRIFVRQFIADRTILPLNPYGYWNTSMLVDKDLKTDINLFLQELGEEITAEKLVEFLAQ